MKKHILSLLIILFSVILYINVPADMGNFNDYSSGSHSSSSDKGSNSPFGPVTAIGVFGFFIYVVIRCAVYERQTKKKIAEIKDNTSQINDEIAAFDPEFDADAFMEWVKAFFVLLQKAWSSRDMSAVRQYEADTLFEQHRIQIKEYLENGRINVLENIVVEAAYLYKYKRNKQYEYLYVYLQCSMIDYIKDEKTNAVLKGDRSVLYRPEYLLTFMRKTGRGTKEKPLCPNCGAPISTEEPNRCEYCGTVIKTDFTSWVLSDMEVMK